MFLPWEVNSSFLGTEFYQRSYHQILTAEESARLRGPSDSSNLNLDLNSVQFDLTNGVKYI